jgi:Mg2+ and Co2+ transporter CorA
VLLEGELVDESYPRIDYFEHRSLIFARLAEIKPLSRHFVRFSVERYGLLVICQGDNIITLCKTRTGIFDQLVERAKKVHASGESAAVSILYTILQYVLNKDKQIVAAVEQELMNLENIPANQRPSNFLEMTFLLRKEVNQLVPSLLHLKEIISVITSKRVPLKGFSEKSENMFDILMDEASYLHETASNARDDLQSLVDLYINTTSYEMNKVMRVIAVMTALGIVPAIILGALGTNLIDNPWDLQLWQVLTGVGVAMLAMGWVFYRMGWLKG